jgi:hypothetical protein
MTDTEILKQAQALAGMDMDDRLDGKLPAGGEDVLIRLLETAGLCYGEATSILEVYGWKRWHAGWKAGYASGRPANLRK